MKNKTIFFGALLCSLWGCKEKDPNELLQMEGMYEVIKHHSYSQGGGGSSEKTDPLQILEVKKQDDENIIMGEELLQFEKKNGENLVFNHKEPYTNYGGWAIYFPYQDSLYIEYRGGGQSYIHIYKLTCKKK